MSVNLSSELAVQRHIILLKLSEALENTPDFGDTPIFDVATTQRQWLSEVGALLSTLGKRHTFRSSFNKLARDWNQWLLDIQGQILDAIEEIKLDLELSGRSEVGSAYSPGEVYRFFC